MVCGSQLLFGSCMAVFMHQGLTVLFTILFVILTVFRGRGHGVVGLLVVAVVVVLLMHSVGSHFLSFLFVLIVVTLHSGKGPFVYVGGDSSCWSSWGAGFGVLVMAVRTGSRVGLDIVVVCLKIRHFASRSGAEFAARADGAVGRPRGASIQPESTDWC